MRFGRLTSYHNIVHENNEPVFLTKNGYGDMVVLSMEAYENLQFESEVYAKLLEAEREAEHSDKTYLNC